MSDPQYDFYPDDNDDLWADEPPQDRIHFANPGSALRAASKTNPRDRPCPTCGQENVLTRKDVQLHYQCDRCADRAERGMDY
jgi:hypothetical protein